MRAELCQPNIERNNKIEFRQFILSMRPLVEDAEALTAFKQSFCCRLPHIPPCDQCFDKTLLLRDVTKMQLKKPDWATVSGELQRLLAQPDVEPPPPPPIRVCESCSMEAHDESPFKRARHA